MIYQSISKLFLEPLPLLLVLAGAAMVRQWTRRRVVGGRPFFITASYLALFAVSLPAVSFPAMGTLEWSHPPVNGRPADVGALVVLSAGVMASDKTRLRDELSDNSIRRCLHAAELYRQGPPCPVIVSGGLLEKSRKITPDALLMRDLLVRLDVAESDIIVEPNSKSTFENAVESRKILNARGIRNTLVVTEAFHMPRALRCFWKQGIDALPAACGHQATEFEGKFGDFVPSPGAIRQLTTVTHEWIGLAWYWLSGKI